MGNELRIRYDSVADAVYIRLSDKKVAESEEVSPGIIIDYSEEGEIVGIEILNFSKRRINLSEIIIKGPEVLRITT